MMMGDSSFEDLFCNRIGVLATMHQKETVVAPILEHNLGVQMIVPQDFNTDEFGTFTRDVRRPGDQANAARLKAEAAMAATGLTLAVASEGSFGPHPSIPLLACNYEIVLLSDRQHDLEITGQAISTKTNYRCQRMTELEAALAFAQTIGFPTHGLVVMSDAQPTQSSHIVKGITDRSQLIETVTWFLKKFGQAHLETDMRAMHNPTRMNVIAEATHDLIRNISHCCPRCRHPGFVAIDYAAGLPCALCGSATELTLAVTHGCKKCHFSSRTYFPNQQERADPAQCSYCNP